MHGREGHAWQGGCMVGGDMCGWGHVWQGVCMAGGMHGRGVCMMGEHAWWGACVAGGVCARYYEIRSMSGRYASYWSAFLLGQSFSKNTRIQDVI